MSPRGAALLRQVQTKNGPSMEALAARCGVSNATIHSVLNFDQRVCDFLPALCSALRVSLYEVVNGLTEEDGQLLAAYHRLRNNNAALATSQYETIERLASSYDSAGEADPPDAPDPPGPSHHPRRPASRTNAAR